MERNDNAARFKKQGELLKVALRLRSMKGAFQSKERDYSALKHESCNLSRGIDSI